MSEGFLGRLKQSLSKTRESLVGKVQNVLGGKTVIDEELYEELEEILIQADIGFATTEKILDNLRDTIRERKITDPQDIVGLLKEQIEELLIEDVQIDKEPLKNEPLVIMVVGVNGVGKTTSIGKIANLYMSEGKKVILGAGDTFRAAAIDQLKVWADRAGVDIISHQPGADPAAVAHDTIQAAKARGSDVVIIDTAGRLHTKVNLMEELKKIERVIKKSVPDGPHQTLLVLDAETGQNAVQQAKTFSDAVDISGIVLTKLDGTAKGGIILAIKDTLGIPVKYIGIGEKIDDLKPFAADAFLEALFADLSVSK